MKRLGEQLAQAGLIRQDQLQSALHEQTTHGGRLGSILVEQGALSVKMLAAVLSHHYGATMPPQAWLEEPDPLLVEQFPRELVEEHRFIPLRCDRGRLHVATINPADHVLNSLAASTGHPVKPYVLPELVMDEWLEWLFEMGPRRVPTVPPSSLAAASVVQQQERQRIVESDRRPVRPMDERHMPPPLTPASALLRPELTNATRAEWRPMHTPSEATSAAFGAPGLGPATVKQSDQTRAAAPHTTDASPFGQARIPQAREGERLPSTASSAAKQDLVRSVDTAALVPGRTVRPPAASTRVGLPEVETAAEPAKPALASPPSLMNAMVPAKKAAHDYAAAAETAMGESPLKKHVAAQRSSAATTPPTEAFGQPQAAFGRRPSPLDSIVFGDEAPRPGSAFPQELPATTQARRPRVAQEARVRGRNQTATRLASSLTVPSMPSAKRQEQGAHTRSATPPTQAQAKLESGVVSIADLMTKPVPPNAVPSQLRTTTSRHELLDLTLRAATHFCPYVMAMAVRPGELVATHLCERGSGPRPSPRLRVPVLANSFWERVVRHDAPPLRIAVRPDSALSLFLLNAERPAVPEFLLLPVMRNGRVITVIYADNGDAPVPDNAVTTLVHLVSELSTSCNRLARRNQALGAP